MRPTGGQYFRRRSVATGNAPTSRGYERFHSSRVTSSAVCGACYFLAVTEHGVDHWGRYRDRYVPDGDRWLFAHRFVRTDGTTPGGWAASRGYS